MSAASIVKAPGAPLLIFWLLFSSCDEEIKPIQQLYSNDFSGELTGITGGKTIDFDNSTLLGNYNNDGFVLVLRDIPEHNFINVRFDFYAHDSWDGNPFAVGGPDIWWFQVHRKRGFAEGDYIFATSFSNTPCPNGFFCLRQAYPNPFPFSISSRTGALRTMNGLCWFEDRPDGTTIYRIDKVIGHTGDELRITFQDSLRQENALDRLCDESWSLNNLEIYAWE